jgi:hypothetical protein
MDPSVKALRAELDAHLSALGGAQARAGAGLAPSGALPALRAALPEARQPETFHAVMAARGGASERAARRLLALAEWVAGEVEGALAAEADAEVGRLEAHGSVSVDEQVLPFPAALAQVPREPLRPRRAVLERGLSDFLLSNRSPYARRVDGAALAAERLGFSGYTALRDAVAGFSHGALSAQGEAVLAHTHDAYADLLGYALRRLDVRLRPQPQGEAQLHDVLAAARAPFLEPLLPREDLQPALQRWLGELGLTWSAQGRVRVDLEERPGKSARPFVARVRVPDEVHLVAWRRGGLEGWSALLHELGHAHHWAHADGDAPVEDRWMGDASVTEAWATLFECLLLDEGWLRRYLRLGHAQAREVARMAAFSQLALLRRTAVRLAHALDVHARGPGLALADAWAERGRVSLLAETPRGFYLHALAPQLYAARYLRAWALEAPVRRLLQERFNEDWWRNPGAGAWLRAAFARGARDDADALAREWTGGELQLAPAARGFVAVMAA